MDGGEAGRGGEGAGAGGTYEALYNAGEVRTPFATEETVPSMKAMLADAKPEQVLGVAEAWERIHDHLVNGGGSVQGDFDRIVAHTLEHWEGPSAEAFAELAAKISRQLGELATYARYTSTAMRNAGERLNEIKPKIDALGRHDDVSGAMNRLGDAVTGRARTLDAGFRGELDTREPEDDVPESEGDQRQHAVALMVDLALTYNSQRQALSSWERKLPPRRGGDDGRYPGEPGGVPPMPGPGVGRVGEPAPTAAAVAAAAAGAAHAPAGGQTTAGRRSGKPAVATAFDGISGGTATATGSGSMGSGGTGTGVGGTGTGAGGTGTGVGAVGSGLAGAAAGSGAGPAYGGSIRAGRGADGSRLPAGLGTDGTGRSGSARGAVGGGTGRAAASGRGLHFSRGGALAGERGRKGGRAVNPAFLPDLGGVGGDAPTDAFSEGRPGEAD